MTVDVDELTNADECAWDEFVRGSPDALPHHLLGWRDVIQRTYGYRSRYLLAKEGGKVVGVMPLFEIRSHIEGYHFSTLPGGLCAASDDVGHALVRWAEELVRSKNARFLAIRDSRHKWDDDLVSRNSQCSVVVDVSEGLAAVRKNLSRSVRQRLAQGCKSGVELSCGSDHLGAFHHVLSDFLRSKGTPVFPNRYLTTQVEVFPKNVRLVSAHHRGQLIAGAISFLLGSALFGINLFAFDADHKLKVNHLLYWDRIELACEQGLERVDFGRSTIGSGQYDFKMSWNGIEVPIYQQFWLNRTQKLPYHADNAEIGKGRLFTRVWQRVPLPVTQMVGPIIRRELPFV